MPPKATKNSKSKGAAFYRKQNIHLNGMFLNNQKETTNVSTFNRLIITISLLPKILPMFKKIKLRQVLERQKQVLLFLLAVKLPVIVILF